MFHIAKILEVISPEEKGSKSAGNDTHALLEMWDENLIIFKVSPLIAKEVKEGNYVLVDYSPVPVAGAPVSRHEVVSIVTDAKGKKITAKMREYLEEKKRGGKGQALDSFGIAGKMIG